jgi:hypothetical protein
MARFSMRRNGAVKSSKLFQTPAKFQPEKLARRRVCAVVSPVAVAKNPAEDSPEA